MTMSRRRLLWLGSASAFALMVPPSAIATPLPDYAALGIDITKLELIDHALDIAGQYWSWPHIQAQVFDIDSAYVTITTQADVRHYMHELAFTFGGRAFWERLFLLLDIRENFERRLGPDVAVHRRWLSNTQIIYERATANDMMLSAAPGDMRHVLWVLESV